MTAEELLAVLQSLTSADRGAIDAGMPRALPGPVTPSMPDYLGPLQDIQAQAAIPMTQRPDNYGSSVPSPVAEAPAVPTIASAPQQADVPLSPDAVPNSAFALTEPRTTLPPMPTPPQSVASDPRRDLLRMIVLGFMAGAGPKSGFGTGAGQGLLHGQAVQQAELDKTYKIQEAEALRQQTIFAAQQRAEHQDRQRMLAAIETRVRQMPDIETYQREMRGYGERMVLNGFRGDNAAALMRLFPFVPPEHDPKMVAAWAGWKKTNQQLLDQKPDEAATGTIDVNVAPRGKPPQMMRLPVAEVAKAAGEGFAQDANGKVIVVPKAAAASGEFPTKLRSLQDEFQATYHRSPDARENAALIDQAAKFVMQHTASAITIGTRQQDAKDIAQGIIAGIHPADTSGLGLTMGGAVHGELMREGFDYKSANLDWVATKRYLSSVNSTQQVRFRQAVETARKSVDIIDDLATQWKANARLPILNKANLVLAQNGAYGQDVASLARQLDGQITDVTAELAQVFMGGNSPTDAAFKLAEKNLRADWDQKVLLDMTKLLRKNLDVRSASITHGAPVGMSTGGGTPDAHPPINRDGVSYIWDGTNYRKQ